MADAKKFPLEIVIKALDQATGPIRAINDRLKPLREAHKALGKEVDTLGEGLGALGFGKVSESLRGVGSALSEVLSKFALLAGAAIAAAYGVKGLLDSYAGLAHTAKTIGTDVDTLAGLHYAAKLAGVSVESLDEGLENLNKNVGLLKAGKGRLAKFLGDAPLAKQLKGAKDVGEEIDLIANAMQRLKGHSDEEAAFAKQLGLDPKAILLFEQGGKSIEGLKAHYAKLAGSQKKAAEAGLKFEEAMADVDASLDGVKASIAENLGPALTHLAEQFTAFLGAHREEIAAFIKDFGEKLPGRIQDVIDAFKSAIDFIRPVWDAIGGLKGVAIGLAAAIGGPLLIALGELSIALLTTPVGVFLLACAALAAVALVIAKNWDRVKDALQGALDVLVKMGGAVATVAAPLKALISPLPGGVDRDVLERAFAFSHLRKNISEGVKTGVGPDPFAEPSFFDVPKKFAAGAASGPSGFAQIKVDFINAPRGMRVTTDPGSSDGVSLDVGTQFGGFIP